jgi:hypothetical protein
MELSQEAIQARRAYQRKWREANKHKTKEYHARHFEKQAKKMAESQIQTTNERNDQQ